MYVCVKVRTQWVGLLTQWCGPCLLSFLVGKSTDSGLGFVFGSAPVTWGLTNPSLLFASL